MPPDEETSVSGWIEQMKQGQDSAVRHLWDRYFQQMVEVARGRLPEQLRPVVGSEDVALSAFFDVVTAARAEQLPQLSDRQDLWRLLFAFTVRKVIDHLRKQHAQRRGAGKVFAASPEQLEQALGEMPSPEREALLRDQFEFLLALLPDDQLRDIVRARLDGHSNADVAARFACSERTIERRLQLVRKLWEQCYHHDSE